jgi:hypothetical protein
VRQPDAGLGAPAGLITGAICALAIELKWKLGYDDSLDVVGVHLVGGLIGTLYLGFFATGTGLFVGGGIQQLVVQFIAAFAVLIFSFVVAYVLGLASRRRSASASRTRTRSPASTPSCTVKRATRSSTDPVRSEGRRTVVRRPSSCAPDR